VIDMTDGNIGRRGQRQRLIIGVVNLAVAVTILALLYQAGAVRWWRLAAFPLLLLAAIGVFQARARTCVAHAAKGTCELDDGSRVVADAETAARMRVRARRVMLQSIATAAGVTALALLL
jgi:hypothetical protein